MANLEAYALFVGDIPGNATEANLEAHFRQYGAVSGTTIMRDHATGRCRGFGFVCFSFRSSAIQALQVSHYILGKKVTVMEADMARPQRQHPRNNVWYIRGTIYVDGVGSRWSLNNLTWQQLWIYFQRFGLLTNVDVRLDEFGNCRGFAYVTFVSDDVAEEATLARFHMIYGKVVEVKWLWQRDMVESDNRRGWGHHQPGGSSSHFNYIGSHAPTNDGALHPPTFYPGVGMFTGETGVNSGLIQQGRYAGTPYGNPRNASPQVLMDPSGNPPNVPQLSTYPFVNPYPLDVGWWEVTSLRNMHSRAPGPAMNQRGSATNNGVPQPGFGSFTSGTGVYGDQLLQGGYARFPSGIPQNVPQVSLASVGTRPYVPLVSTYMSRDGGLAAATGLLNMHNRAPGPTMDQLGFVSENALADVNSSRYEYETPDFDGTAVKEYSLFPRQP